MAYEKQTWKAGDEITSERLNHIEEGVTEAPTWEEVANKPETYPTANQKWDDIQNKPETYPATAPKWADVTGKPSEFRASAHTHKTADVEGLDAWKTAIEKRLSALETPPAEG